LPKNHTRKAETIAVVGGGFSGSLLALRLSRARPDLKILLVERRRRPGRGLAYGACADYHLLNVPVARMEVGLEPSFTRWLECRRAQIADALQESGGNLAEAFVPRELFGQYMQERAGDAVALPEGNVRVIRGEAVRILTTSKPSVVLDDGRTIAADRVVLATGNLPPRSPVTKDAWLYDHVMFVSDPWARDAFNELNRDAPVLLIGAGLTMVDIVLRLAAQGHRGVMLAVSRHGLIPSAHEYGGSWTFKLPAGHSSPRILTRYLRDECRKAQARGVSWQCVIDAVRPFIASIWRCWSPAEKRQFLRHLRVRWDVVRHRMAPRIASGLQALIDSGQLKILGGRILNAKHVQRGAELEIALRHGGVESFTAERVFNCTGPRSDLATLEYPLLAELRRSGLMVPDRLGLGIETDDAATIDSEGNTSDWLFALGPLTRPSSWEVTAVPEITEQVGRLVKLLAGPNADV
jgi:uncharacterized NAD(P)/FAD-binding protein YdhS